MHVNICFYSAVNKQGTRSRSHRKHPSIHGPFHAQELQQFCQQLPQLISTMSLYHTKSATYIGIASFKAHSPSFFSPSSLWKLTFIFGRRVASSDWSNWSKWAASPWCTVSGEMDGRKWSEWCGATASGKKAVKLDAIGPKPCPWWPSAKQVECPSWLCWPVRSDTKLLIADFKAMLLSNKAFDRQTKLLLFPTDTDPKQLRTRKIAELNHIPSDSGLNISFIPEYASECLLCTSWHEALATWLDFIDPYLAVSRDTQATSPLVSIIARRIVIAVLSVLRLCLIWRPQITSQDQFSIFFHHSESHIQNICVETHEQRCAMRDSQFSRLSCILHT